MRCAVTAPARVLSTFHCRAVIAEPRLNIFILAITATPDF
jgi:hypothetical protein